MENKKRRLAPLAGSSLSISSLATILGKLSEDPGTTDPKRATAEAQAISKEVQACVAIRTPFGKLIQEFDLPLKNGGTHKLLYADPAALFYLLCSRSTAFARLLAKTQSAGPAGHVLYGDETTPGNILRPDHSREALCLYHTLRELPAWFRNRRNGWFVFGFIRTK